MNCNVTDWTALVVLGAGSCGYVILPANCSLCFRSPAYGARPKKTPLGGHQSRAASDGDESWGESAAAGGVFEYS